MNDGETKVNGSPTEQAEPSADTLEDDGWSTVASKARPSKKVCVFGASIPLFR